MYSTRVETTHIILLGVASLSAGLGAVLGRALEYLRLFDAGGNIALLLALIAFLLGGSLYRSARENAVVGRLGLASMIAAAISLLPTPFLIVILPIVFIIVFFIWSSAEAGWRWWAATTVASAGGLLAGVVLSGMFLFIVGTGDPRWNLPRWFGISVEFLDFLTLLAITLIAGGIGGLAGTRSISRAPLVSLVSGAVAVGFWVFAVHPQHTNEITWTMPLRLELLFAVSILLSILLASWPLRPEGRQFGAKANADEII